MATAVHENHVFDPALRATRARLGVLLLILSDAGFVAAMYASQSYLHILNWHNQFLGNGQPPSIAVGLILSLVMVVSAGAYYWGQSAVAQGDLNRYRTGLLVAWVLTLIAFIAQLFVLFGLHYAIPTHAFGSLVIIMSAYHAVHLFLTALIGFLVIGRLRNGRIAGFEYITEVTGFWWYYVALTAITTWLMLSFVK